MPQVERHVIDGLCKEKYRLEEFHGRLHIAAKALYFARLERSGRRPRLFALGRPRPLACYPPNQARERSLVFLREVNLGQPRQEAGRCTRANQKREEAGVLFQLSLKSHVDFLLRP